MIATDRVNWVISGRTRWLRSLSGSLLESGGSVYIPSETFTWISLPGKSCDRLIAMRLPKTSFPVLQMLSEVKTWTRYPLRSVFPIRNCCNLGFFAAQTELMAVEEISDFLRKIDLPEKRFLIILRHAMVKYRTFSLKSNVWLKWEWIFWTKMFDLSGCLT